MSLEYDLQNGLADCGDMLGKILMYGGGAGLFVMAIVGTFAIDLVILAFAIKNNSRTLEAFILFRWLWNDGSDPVPSLIASPMTTGIAIALSFLLGVPQVGIGLIAGWLIAAVACFIGYGLIQLARAIRPDPERQFERSSIAKSDSSGCDKPYDPECDPNYLYDGQPMNFAY